MKLKTGKTNKAKSWLFENMNKIDKPLVRKPRNSKIEITNIRNERGTITSDLMDIKRIRKECYKQFMPLI